LTGAVTGRSQDEAGRWGYGVWVFAMNATWDLMADELRSTGKVYPRSDFDTGKSIRVRVDKRGFGTIVPPPDEDR
jgi:hypothetical protein